MSQPFKFCTPSRMDREQFVATFGDIYEHSPWIAEQAWGRGITSRHDTVEELHALLAEVFAEADREARMAVVNAHPDLAGRAALAGELTASSTGEQAGAGLDACTPEELQRFQELNRTYQARFGFPFIMAVKGRHRSEILAAFEQRVSNSPEQEFARALAEINQIALLRLRAL